MVSPLEDQALTLGLGFPSSTTNIINKITSKKEAHHNMMQVLNEEPCLALSLLSSETNQTVRKKGLIDNQEPPCSVISVASSLSNVVSVKREKECVSSEDLYEEEDGSGPTNNNNNNTPRKKLRLSKEQSIFLEESFKQQSTLNPKQKQALADQLNLRPRQVEVWFQNRRARTKLKQTEVDYEYLKKCCETLTDENKKLQKELQDLKAIKLGHPFYMNLPIATLTMCPSCERIGANNFPNSGNNSTPPSKGSFGLGLNKSHFYPSQHIRPLLVD